MAPRRRQSLKAQRKDKKRHARNQQVKTALKKTLKKLEVSFTGKKTEEAAQTLKEAISKLAKAAKKGVLHKNTAQRKISRLSQRLVKLSQAP